MRIKSLELLKNDVTELGLNEFNSTKFNSIIALVGKNGSGKSRYLNVIENKLRNLDISNDLRKVLDFLPPNLLSNYLLYSRAPETYDAYIKLIKLQEKLKNNPSSKEISREVQNALIIFNNLQARQSINQNKVIAANKAITTEIGKRLKVIRPADLRALKASFDSTDKTKVTFQSIIDTTVDNVDVDEFSMISESALSFLQRLPHKLVLDDIETRGDEKKFKSRVAYKRFQLLKDLIGEFLGKDLNWESKSSNVDEHDDHFLVKTTGFWTINGREFNYNQFSDGEKVLFTYAILLFLLNNNPTIKFKESIIIIDEPELNLHPRAQIKLIETLEKLIKDNGQLIIATHSLSIIANLDYGSIFLVRDNALFTPSSSVPFDTVDDLMGFEEHYNKIVEFLVSTPSWAMTNFMAKCFEDPEVFESADKNDPQLEIFRDLILNHKKINILDFGSGKGRLLERIKESEKVWSRIDKYDCFDINEVNNELVLSKGANKVINELNEINDDNYDLVVLVNVLHEIHISFWVSTFNKLKKTLKPNGFIVIIEDIELPIGELPNELGFILLEKEEMKILLGEKISYLSSKLEKYKDRILCSIISSTELNQLDKATLLLVLEKLKMNSLKDIVKFRKDKSKKLNIGRMYGLKANSYVNSQLAIDFLKNEK
uniref:AAA family ATPase n=1 Tax=Gelidibacter sp. TaxID=2018083 RepID=UPI00404B1B23